MGKRIYIDDGQISIVTTEIGANYVIGEVENAGFLGSKKGCNLPGIDIGLPDISDEDIQDIKFAVEQGLIQDEIFPSFLNALKICDGSKTKGPRCTITL